MNFKFLKYLKYFNYYLEVFAKRIGGRGIMRPHRNGEYKVLEYIIKNSKSYCCFIDGGSNVGSHILKFDYLCKKYKVNENLVVAIEPFPSTVKVLKKNLSGINYQLINKALGAKEGKIKFHSDDLNGAGGSNSAINFYYLNHSIEVEQITIDSIIKKESISKINFLKLDIEGYQYNAMIGAKDSLSKGLIDYIQLEYNQTWIEGGGTIEKILNIAKTYSYKLYQIRINDLLSIPTYNFTLDDFYYCNLLLVKDGCPLPLPSRRKAIPLI